MLVCVGVYLLFVYAYDSRYISIIIVGFLTAISRTEFGRSYWVEIKSYGMLSCVVFTHL